MADDVQGVAVPGGAVTDPLLGGDPLALLGVILEARVGVHDLDAVRGAEMDVHLVQRRLAVLAAGVVDEDERVLRQDRLDGRRQVDAVHGDRALAWGSINSRAGGCTCSA